MAIADIRDDRSNEVSRRLSELPKDTRTDLAELAKLLEVEESEHERREIARTMVEIMFPEVMLTWVANQVENDDIEAARVRVDNYRKKIGQEIRRIRKAQGLTQPQLAKKAGLPQSHISRLESGKHAPTHVTVERLAVALGTQASLIDPGFADA